MPDGSAPPKDGSARCGILIIGSLLWNQDAGGHRERWRQNRLDLSAKQHVNVPIRYGRRSQTWGDSFTMILDAEASSGQAVLVPCKAPVSSFEDLIEEVQWLWAAEANEPTSNEFYRGWGCVGSLFRSNEFAQALEDEWRGYFQNAKAAKFPAIDSAGKLNTPWPKLISGAPVEDFEVILGTATMPKPKDNRPNAQQIAKCWIDQNGGHERYFFENVRHGIRTHDDHEIWKAIAAEDPSWLGSGEHDAAIRLLKSELQS